MKHASIVPLIGGETIASQNVFGSRPEYIMSYTPFYDNDKHLLEYYDNEVPYHVLDNGQKPSSSVDIISSVCPCAGLSMLSAGFGDHNENNKWMINTTKYVLQEAKPKVLWGENAPGFAGKIGKNVRAEMLEIADEAGYSMSVYRTKSLLHGVPQVRERSFYFFWEGNKVPIFNYYSKPRVTIEDTILSASKINSMQEVINKKTPTDDPYYRYILEELRGGISHAEHAATIEASSARGVCVYAYIEKQGIDYLTLSKWMEKNNYPKEVEKCIYRYNKLKAGGGIMRRGIIVPKDYIGAFVGHYPVSLTHPVEDRFITYREALSIMGMPDDFMMVKSGNKYPANHICQNVPVRTAEDMAVEVKESLLGNRQWVKNKYMMQNNNAQDIQEEISRDDNSLMGFFNDRL